ncbi:MAG TPA: hypothetical protein VHN20_16010, partial [Beijerinckiaceae bacterium]|nr:hypothetical protein [Beijerinckiaceae bacterium]
GFGVGGISAGVGIAAGSGIATGDGAYVGAGSVARGAFNGLRAGGAVTLPIPDPRRLIAEIPRVSVGAGAQFAPGGRVLSAPSGASLGANVGAGAGFSARLRFGT